VTKLLFVTNIVTGLTWYVSDCFLCYTYLHASFIYSFTIEDWLYIYVHGFLEDTQKKKKRTYSLQRGATEHSSTCQYIRLYTICWMYWCRFINKIGLKIMYIWIRTPVDMVLYVALEQKEVSVGATITGLWEPVWFLASGLCDHVKFRLGSCGSWDWLSQLLDCLQGVSTVLLLPGNHCWGPLIPMRTCSLHPLLCAPVNTQSGWPSVTLCYGAHAVKSTKWDFPSRHSPVCSQ
jgi:hypothetical protein